jgi:hypothetical protein
VIGMAYVLIGILLAAAAVPCEPRTPIPEEPSVESIMAAVARNQAQAQQLRQAYVYNQSLILRFRQGNGKVVREETREYAVMPVEPIRNAAPGRLFQVFPEESVSQGIQIE